MGETTSPVSKRQIGGVYDLVRNDVDEVVIDVYDIVGEDWWGDGTSAKDVRDALRGFSGSSVTVRINSVGGDVFDGIAIYNLLRDASRRGARVTVDVDGLAASAASVIMCAGDVIRCASNAIVMIHNAWTWAVGGSDEMQKTADMLDKINQQIANTYLETIGRLGKETPMDDIRAAMDAETWMTSDEALEFGIVSEQTSAPSVAAMVRAAMAADSLPDEQRRSLNKKLTGSENLRVAGVTTDGNIRVRKVGNARKQNQPAASEGGEPERKPRMERVLRILGAADEDQAVEKANGLVACAALWALVASATGLEGESVVGAVNAWKADAEALPGMREERDVAVAEVETIRNAEKAAKKQQTLDAILASGKATAAEMELLSQNSQEYLDGWLATAQPRLPQQQHEPDNGDVAASALTAEEREICEKQGVDPKDFLAAREDARKRGRGDTDSDEDDSD